MQKSKEQGEALSRQTHASRLEGTPNSKQIAFSPTEAASLVGVGRTFLYAALNSGALKSIKIGSRRLIRLSAIQDWLTAHEARDVS